MTIYIALLRGINVGGKNKIKMADLRESLAALGLSRVQTYIQSGNILFESEEDEATLRDRIEQQIQNVFGFPIKVVIRTANELNEIVVSCPFSDNEIAEVEASAEGECLYVSMLLEEPQADRVEKLKVFDAQDDQYCIKGRNIFLLFRQSVRNSRLAIQVEKLGVPTTTRNWKTINKLATMASEMTDSCK